MSSKTLEIEGVRSEARSLLEVSIRMVCEGDVGGRMSPGSCERYAAHIENEAYRLWKEVKGGSKDDFMGLCAKVMLETIQNIRENDMEAEIHDSRGCAAKDVEENAEFQLPHGLTSLESFELEKVLADEQTVCVYGRFGKKTPGLVKLSRPPIATENLSSMLSAITLSSRSTYSGTEYGYYHGSTPASVAPSLSVDIICPHGLPEDLMDKDTQDKLLAKHVARNTSSAPRLFFETAELYKAVTLPYIGSIPQGALQWLYNILEGKKEMDRMLYNSTDPLEGFLLNIDTKWKSHPDCSSTPKSEWLSHPCTKELYCLAICHRRDIRSLRDLTFNELGLLQNIRSKGLATIKDVYGLEREEVRIFVHYQPQFYHFHVHFTSLYIDYGVFVERAHLLDDIIENIKMNGTYYQTKTLGCRLHANDPLWEKYLEYRG